MNPFGYDPAKNPFLEFGKLMEQFKVPGIDMGAVVEAQRKNIEALTQANQVAYAGMQELVRRQAEILQQTMLQWQSAMAQMGGANPANLAGQAEAGRQALDKAIASMRELAELAVRSQTQAWEVIQKRTQENIAELTRLMQPK